MFLITQLVRCRAGFEPWLLPAREVSDYMGGRSQQLSQSALRPATALGLKVEGGCLCCPLLHLLLLPNSTQGSDPEAAARTKAPTLLSEGLNRPRGCTKHLSVTMGSSEWGRCHWGPLVQEILAGRVHLLLALAPVLPPGLCPV